VSPTVFVGLPRDPLEAFVARGIQAQAHVDRILEDLERDDEAACISCGCTWTRACYPPCSWRSEYDLPLCSSCAPPLVLDGDVDVDDQVLERVLANPGLCPGDLRFAMPEHDTEAAVHRLLAEDLVRLDDAGGLRTRRSR
jgi:hypothetical protein